MARKRVDAPVGLDNWEAADDALREIGNAQRLIEAAEHSMQDAIDAAKERAAVETAPYRQRIAELESRLSVFAETHRDDLGSRKSREMNYGTLGYRKSTRLILPRAAAKVAQIIEKLRANGMGDCIIKPAEKIDKDALKKYPPNDIIEVGAGLDVQDTFWYEVDREKLMNE